MPYIIEGEICGRLCPECDEPLEDEIVRFYRTEREPIRNGGENGGGTATLVPVKQTLAVLSPEQVATKKSLLLGEAKLDNQGRFKAELQKDYDGGSFEIDVYCGTVPHLKGPPKHEPIQFSVTVLQPEWEDERAEWEICLPSQFWSAIRKSFGAWTICGHCHAGGSGVPVPDVEVSAWDVDWLQDDPLGTGTSDASGHFRIDYSTADFERTPFAGVLLELTQPGPDVYFKAQLLGANVLDEPPSRGRAPDREDVGAVLCVDLELDVGGTPPEVALFTAVGDFSIDSDIDTGTGLTNWAVAGHGGADYGFWGSLLLSGACPAIQPGGSDRMRYRFLYDDGTGSHPIAGASLVSQARIGYRYPIMWDTNGSGPVAHFQPIDLVPTGANSPEDQTPAVVPPLGTPWGPVPPHVVVPDADGWVTVPTLTLDGVLFDLMSFNSAGVVPGGTAPVGPAGQADPTPENGRTISITFEAATVSNATPLFTNGLSTIYVDNWIEAHALDLVQFGTSACSGIGAALDIEYTVDHERMRSWSVGISSAAGAQPLSTPLPSGTGPRGSFGIVNENTSGWAKCSYTLSLTALLSMTNGTIDDSGRTYPLTFCKT